MYSMIKKIPLWLWLPLTLYAIGWCGLSYLRYTDRKAYADHTAEEMDAIIKHEFGENAKRVDSIPCEDSDNILYIYRLSCTHKNAGSFYIAAKNNFFVNHNLFTQLLKSNAADFWKGRERNAVLVSIDGKKETPLNDEINNIDHALDPTDWRLSVSCKSSEEFETCAEELDEWFDYCMQDDGLYYRDTYYSDPVLEVEIRMGTIRFWIEMKHSDVYEKEPERLNRKETIIQLLETEYKKKADPDALEREKKQAWAASFMERYDGDYVKECLLEGSDIRYRMVCTDHALVTYSFALLKSCDGGKSWEVREIDPFAGLGGTWIDFTFLTEEFGFAALIHAGGDWADLYVTEDGGLNYHPCTFKGGIASLDDEKNYNPYDCPQMPYEEDDRLYVICKRGTDGVGAALFTSTDHGYTFIYERIYIPSSDI